MTSKRVGAQRGMPLAQRQHVADPVVQRFLVRLLGLDRRRVGGGVDRQVQVVGIGRGEAEVGARVPLHRGAGAGADVAALLGGQVAVPHADLVAVVQERHAGHRQDHAVGDGELLRRQPRRQAGCVVVAGDQAEVAFVLGGFVLRQVLVEESVDAAAAVRGEVAVVSLPVSGSGVLRQSR